MRDDLLKVYKNNKLIFTELIFTGRSKFYSKLRSESELELLQSVQFMLGDKFFLNNLNLLVAPVIDNEKLLRNNPLLSDILSVDDTGELGKSFLSDKIHHLRNKFPLLDSYSDSDIEKMIDYSKNELFKLFAENEGDLS